MVDYTYDLIFDKPAPGDAPGEALATEAFLNGTYTFLGYLKNIKEIDPSGISSLVFNSLNIVAATTTAYYASAEYKKLHKLNTAMMSTESTLNLVGSPIGILKSPLIHVTALGAATPFLAFAGAGFAWAAFAVTARNLLRAIKKSSPEGLLKHNLNKIRKLNERIKKIKAENSGKETDEISILSQKVANATTKAIVLGKYLAVKGNAETISNLLKGTGVSITDDKFSPSERNLVEILLTRQRAKVEKLKINTTIAFLVAASLTVLALGTVASLGTAPAIIAATVIFSAILFKTGQAVQQWYKDKQHNAVKNKKIADLKEELLAKVEVFKNDGHDEERDAILKFSHIASPHERNRERRLYSMAYEYHKEILTKKDGHSTPEQEQREFKFYETLHKLPEKRRKQLFEEILEKNVQKVLAGRGEMVQDISAQNRHALLTTTDSLPPVKQDETSQPGRSSASFFARSSSVIKPWETSSSCNASSPAPGNHNQ